MKRLDQEKHQLVWLTPALTNNTWTIAVRQDLAEKNKLTSLADLSRYLKQGGEFKLAASAEFIERPDALRLKKRMASTSTRTSCCRWPGAIRR